MSAKSFTRRNFLKSASLAATGPLLLSSGARGQTAPSNRLNLALIGAGGRGSGLMNDTVNLSNAQVVAVCDCYEDRRASMAAKLNKHYRGKQVQAYRDFREILARDDIDGVIVATPDHWHVPIAVAAAHAGKSMYVEKPLGVSMDWAKTLRSAVNASKSVFQYGTQQRSSPLFRQACELVRNGYLGEITRVEAWCSDMSSQYNDFHVPRYGSTEPALVPEGFDYDLWLGPAPERPYTVDRCTRYGAFHIYDYSLGFISGWGAHPLDIAQWGLGTDDTSPVRYEGQGSIPAQGLYDTIDSWDVHCTYGNGVGMRFMGHRVAEAVVTAYRPWKDHGTTFFGSEGWISVDRGGLHTSDPKLLEVKLEPEAIRLSAPASHMEDFITCARTGGEPVSTLESGIRSDTISHLSDLSIRLGRPIHWDPEAEAIVDDEAANSLLKRSMRPPWELAGRAG